MMARGTVQRRTVRCPSSSSSLLLLLRVLLLVLLPLVLAVGIGAVAPSRPGSGTPPLLAVRLTQPCTRSIALARRAQRAEAAGPRTVLLHELRAASGFGAAIGAGRAWSGGRWIFHLLAAYLWDDGLLDGVAWAVVCPAGARVNWTAVRRAVADADDRAACFIGVPLVDRRPVLPHHFATSTRAYPHPLACFALHREALRCLREFAAADNLSSEAYHASRIDWAFHIDPYYELAAILEASCGETRLCAAAALAPRLRVGANPHPIGLGTLRRARTLHLTTAEAESAHLHSWARRAGWPGPGAAGGRALPPAAVAFVVRSAEPLHDVRLHRFVLRTWGRIVRQSGGTLLIYSDVADPSVPTIAVGVPNTQRGHCLKLRTILVRLARSPPPARWIFVADDDTIVDPLALAQLLARHNASQPIIVGQRFGFGWRYRAYGQDYPTLGPGAAISMAALHVLGHHLDGPDAVPQCACRAPDAPDDMWLGLCAAFAGVSVVHESGFHQGTWHDYHPQLLDHEPHLVSFHGLRTSDLAEEQQVFATLLLRSLARAHLHDVRVRRRRRSPATSPSSADAGDWAWAWLLAYSGPWNVTLPDA